MNITLMVITDGRGQYLKPALASASENLIGDFANFLMIDDSGSPEYAKWLDETFPAFKIIHHENRRGFCKAIQSGWANLPSNTDYIFHLEGDFTFNLKINLNEMMHILDINQYLCQMALRRQPWGCEPPGGFVAVNPNSYFQKSRDGFDWFEHRCFFTTNPSLYPIRIVKYEWPDPPNGEGIFAFKLWPEGYWAAFLGKLTDPPMVHHIGKARSDAGGGY